jgi:uncharacterized Zn-binding protein involved in type VI secretion
MPAVTRIGDADVAHCSGMVRAAGSGNVFANGIGISRVGDNNTGHVLPGSPCPGHAVPISSGSAACLLMVFLVVELVIQLAPLLAAGSSNVFAG